MSTIFTTLRNGKIKLRAGRAGAAVIMSLLLSTALPARAQVDADFSVGGGVRPGWSSSTCNASIAGAIRYNSGSGGSIDFCNGSSWANVSSAGVTAASPDRGIQFNSGGAFTASSSLIYSTTGRLGLGASTPSYLLSLDGDTANQTIGMERETTAATAGRSLTLQAGGARSAGTDLAGGNLILSGGTATGNGVSEIQIYSAVGLASGTGDVAPQQTTKFGRGGLSFPKDATGYGAAIMFNADVMWGTGDRYMTSDSAFQIYHDTTADVLKIGAAAAGTAGNSFSYTDAMTIDTAGMVSFTSAARFTGDITSASLGASQNNYAPTGLAGASVIRLTASTPISITGLTGGSDGRVVTLMNVGANAITLTDEDAASTAANRFALTQNLAMAPDQSTVLIYDSTSSRWRVFGADGLGGAGSPALSAITAATSTPAAIANSTYSQTWNWALTGATADAFSFGESTAATGGSGDQSILKATTLASSTAIPLMVTNLGNGISFRVNDATGDTDTSPFVVDAAGNVGIGTTTATYALTLDGDTANQVIGMGRETTNDLDGRSLTIQAGGGDAGSADNIGGTLILSGGISTGTEGSSIEFHVAAANTGSGSTDHNPARSAMLSQYGLDLGIVPGNSGMGQAIKFNAVTPSYNGVSQYIEDGSTFSIYHDRSSNYLGFYGTTGTTGSNINTYVEAMTISAAGRVNLTNAVQLSNDITSASLGASQNNYNPTNLSTSSVIRLTASTPISITGLQGGADGRIITLMNVGANAITLTDEDAASTAANRFALTQNLSLATDQSTVLIYDSTSSRWRVFGADGTGSGSAVSPPATETIAAAATITANACGTLKQIQSTGAVTTNTTDTFTASTTAGCCMDVLNADTADTITLDANTKFKTSGGANLALGPDDMVRVCSNGTNWYQAAPMVANQ